MNRERNSSVAVEGILRISKANENWNKVKILLTFERIIGNLRSFASEREEKRYTLQSYTEIKSRSCIHLPRNSVIEALFDLCASISYFLTSFTATFYVFFLNMSSNQLPTILSKLTESIIALDFLLKVTRFLLLEKSGKCTQLNSEKLYFTLKILPEFLALFPFYLLHTGLVWLRLFRIFTINRLIYWIEESYITKRILSEVLVKDEYLRKSIIGLLKFIALVSITCHVIACIWYYITTVEDYPQNWIQDRYSDDQEKFIASLYWTTVTFTSVGYGDIVPKTVPEYIFTMFVQFLGIMVFAYLMGHVNTYISNIDKKKNAIHKRENELDRWIFELDRNYPQKVMPVNIQKEIRDFYKFQWENDDTYIENFNEFMAKLPINLKHEMNIYVYKSRIEFLGPFTLGVLETTIYELASNMKPRLEGQAVEIIKKDSKSKYFYVIKSGNIFAIDDEPFIRLSPKSYFGETCVLFNEKSDFQYITDGECTLFTIHNSVFLKIPKTDFRVLALRAFRRNKYFHMVNKEFCKDDSECNLKSFIEEFNIYSEDVNESEIQEFEIKLSRTSKDNMGNENKYIRKIKEMQEIQYRKLIKLQEDLDKVKYRLDESYN